MNFLKVCTALAVVVAAGWFAVAPNFVAVFLGIVSLSILMMAFLPIPSNKKI